MKKYKTRRIRIGERLKVGTVLLIPKGTQITTNEDKPNWKSKKNYTVKVEVPPSEFDTHVFWEMSNGYWCSALKTDVLVVTGLQ